MAILPSDERLRNILACPEYVCSLKPLDPTNFCSPSRTVDLVVLPQSVIELLLKYSLVVLALAIYRKTSRAQVKLQNCQQ